MVLAEIIIQMDFLLNMVGEAEQAPEVLIKVGMAVAPTGKKAGVPCMEGAVVVLEGRLQTQ